MFLTKISNGSLKVKIPAIILAVALCFLLGATITQFIVYSKTSAEYDLLSSNKTLSTLRALLHQQEESLKSRLGYTIRGDFTEPLMGGSLDKDAWESSLLGFGNTMSVKYGFFGMYTYDKNKKLIHQSYNNHKKIDSSLLGEIKNDSIFKTYLNRTFKEKSTQLAYMTIKDQSLRVVYHVIKNKSGSFSHVAVVLTTIDSLFGNLEKTFGHRIIARLGKNYIGLKNKEELNLLSEHNFKTTERDEDGNKKTIRVKHLDLPKSIFGIESILFVFKDVTELESSSNSFFASFALVSLLLLLLVTAIGYYLGRRLSKPIEFVLKEIEEISTNLSKESLVLHEASKDLLTRTSDQTLSLEQSSTMFTEILGIVNNTVSNTNRASKDIEAATEAGTNGIKNIQNVLVSVSEIAESNHKLKEMAQFIRNIDEKTKIINDIVYNTKTLSFNAAVEADRIDLKAQGFSVIADQIRKLALSSGDTAVEIQDTVRLGYQDINDIMRSTGDSIAFGENISQEASEMFQVIERNIIKIKKQILEISLAAHEQEGALKQTNQAIKELEQDATGIFDQSTNLKNQSRRLESFSKRLTTRVHQLSDVVFGDETQKGDKAA